MTDIATTARSLPVVSTDGHCGATVQDYKPYLAKALHDEFDAWAATYQNPWGDYDTESGDFRTGSASYLSSLNWDNDRRNQLLGEQGISGEVLFPNTAPPFFPSGGSLGAFPPRTQAEYELRFAGLQAHNRWLADFCAAAPGRRAGIAQVFLNDVDAAIAEVRSAAANGLRGVLLPPDHNLGLSNLYYPRYEPLWAVCEELQMPLHRHGNLPGEVPSAETGDTSLLIALTELPFFTHRPLVHLTLSGVFDRYPSLALVMTENRAAGVLTIMARLDAMVKFARIPGSVGDMFGGDAARRLKRLPSEYVRTNVFHGSFFDSSDIAHRHEVGVSQMMWGADFPHHEGTSPFTREALRVNFAGLPDSEVRAMTADNAVALYRLDAAALQAEADRIAAPSLADLQVPVDLTNIPAEHRQYCPTFGEGVFVMSDTK
jgi:predicted TIM-barrel fold metal-dependent hydrolase